MKKLILIAVIFLLFSCEDDYVVTPLPELPDGFEYVNPLNSENTHYFSLQYLSCVSFSTKNDTSIVYGYDVNKEKYKFYDVSYDMNKQLITSKQPEEKFKCILTRVYIGDTLMPTIFIDKFELKKIYDYHLMFEYKEIEYYIIDRYYCDLK